MASVIKLDYGFRFTSIETTGVKEVVELKLHYDESSAGCEEITIQCIPELQQGTIVGWKIITKKEGLPENIREMSCFKDDSLKGKYCELVAVKVLLQDGTHAYLIVANKHNGDYCRRVTVNSSRQGIILDTYI